MSRRRDPKAALASGFGLLGAYPIWQWVRGLDGVQQLYADNPTQEFIWMIGILVITASVIAGCFYAVLAWVESRLE